MTYTKEAAASAILDACRQLTAEGLIARTWGNVSARLSEREFLITPSGRAYETMTKEDLVQVSISDLTWEGELKPSSEKGMHAGIYRLRPDCHVIIHTHQSNASAISVLGENIDLQTLPSRVWCTAEEAEILGGTIPCAFYGLSSTKRLAKHVASAAREYPLSRTILMRYHGAVCMGADKEEALQAAETLEKVCGKLYEKRTGEKLPGGHGCPAEYWIREHGGKYRIHTRTPYIMEMSRRGKTVMPYLDDMAQIGGTAFRCVPPAPTGSQVRVAMKGSNVIFIRDDGAVCTAEDPSEAEAIAIVLEKNCQAANLAVKKAIPPVNGLSAKLERIVYQKKYSKLKDADGPEGRGKKDDICTGV